MVNVKNREILAVYVNFLLHNLKVYLDQKNVISINQAKALSRRSDTWYEINLWPINFVNTHVNVIFWGSEIKKVALFGGELINISEAY